MSRTLFLHLGPSKTGTSAIQGFFRDHCPTSILYPETGRWPDGSHHKLIFAFNGKTKYGPINIPPWKQLLLELDNEISNSSSDILISSERASIKFVTALLPLVAKNKLELHLVLTVRNPLERAASAYNQNVKDPVVGMNEDPDEYLRKNSDGFAFKPVYEAWSSLNSPIIVIPYKGQLPLIQRFCSALGMPLDKPEVERRANKSMGGKALLTLLIANKMLKGETQRRAFFTQLREDKSFKVWKGSSFPFSDSACHDFSNAIKADIDWIIKKFGFSESSLNATEQKAFSLSNKDIQDIYTQLEKAGLAEKNTQLIAKTLEPFCHE